MCDTQAKQQTEQVLLQHSKRYPAMTPCDAVKLLYQNEFGGGHLIKDPQASLLRLKEEYGRITHDTSAPLCEDIGNGYARLNLHALDDTVLSLDMVNRIFVQSSSELSGTREAFQQKLELLTTLTAKGVFHFAEDSLHQYLTEYAAQGYPAVSHSQIYR